jgi:hypothetical protein
MAINLLETLVDFLKPLPGSVTQMDQDVYCNDDQQNEQRDAVIESVTDLRKHSTAFAHYLALYAAAARDQRQPEKLRSAVTNLIRSNEYFKKHFNKLCPTSGANAHPLVGCLYGYSQPRTATLDKAALVAQETMIDIWSLDENALAAYVESTRIHLKDLNQIGNELIARCGREIEYADVA